MKKLYYLIVLALILGLVLTGCLLSNVGQVPVTEQSGVAYLTKGVPISVDLVGLWRFNSNATDSSGNGNDGTVYGGEIYEDPSPMGQALSFDGVGDYVEVPVDVTLDITNEITIEAWIKVAFHKNYNAIVIKGEDGAENYELLLYNSGRVHCPIKFTDGSRVWLNAEAAITDTEWHHVAMTYKPGEWRIYVDGVQKAERTDIVKNPLTNNIPLFIGAEQYQGSFRAERFFNGLIDEVRIWNRALSQGQLGSVIYDFGGILPPIKADGSSVFKLGRTIPVKFQLWDDQGNFVTDAEANIFLQKFDNGDPDGDPMEGDSTSAASTGTEFRYDFTSNQYIFNLATKLLSTGTWQIRILLDDGMSYYVKIGLK